jgi:hypothetical protein
MRLIVLMSRFYSLESPMGCPEGRSLWSRAERSFPPAGIARKAWRCNLPFEIPLSQMYVRNFNHYGTPTLWEMLREDDW